jgi:SAM-dependent methyltransferase
MPTREIAVGYPKGDLALGVCRTCGFITNTRFDSTLHEYSAKYEETQGYSPTFNTFHRRLADSLIERHDLHNKDIVEIGCGKGEFLTMLCRLGRNRGVGFDPAYLAERNHLEENDDVRFVTDFYSDKYAHHAADLIVCKMTLEHIQNTGEFIRMLRRSVGDRPGTTMFFQVPDAMRVFSETAFWDIYYEHCSYFSAGSLARLFRHCGFEVSSLSRDYEGQYLIVEAHPHRGDAPAASLPEEEDLAAVKSVTTAFEREHTRQVALWNQMLSAAQDTGLRVMVWGSGSKGVAFLNAIEASSVIEYGVDINPYRQGMFMAGTGQQIVGPEFVRVYRPDIVIVMNPIYEDEIRRNLNCLGVSPLLVLATKQDEAMLAVTDRLVESRAGHLGVAVDGCVSR